MIKNKFHEFSFRIPWVVILGNNLDSLKTLAIKGHPDVKVLSLKKE